MIQNMEEFQINNFRKKIRVYIYILLGWKSIKERYLIKLGLIINVILIKSMGRFSLPKIVLFLLRVYLIIGLSMFKVSLNWKNSREKFQDFKKMLKGSLRKKEKLLLSPDFYLFAKRFKFKYDWSIKGKKSTFLFVFRLWIQTLFY